MIDREHRDRLARSICRLAAGVISNDRFEVEALETLQPDDPALVALFEAAWGLYGDLSTYRLRGRHRLSRQARREICRWIVFLHSDLEYEWPDEGRLVPRPGCAAVVLSLGRATSRWRRDVEATMRAIGTWDLWPFFRAADLETARRRPRLLSGARPQARRGGIMTNPDRPELRP